MNELILRKNGGFYSVYGDDCYILFYLLGYKIVGDKVGFPISAYNKVIELGKNKCKLKYRIDNIIEKMNLLNEEDIDNILSYIESYER